MGASVLLIQSTLANIGYEVDVMQIVRVQIPVAAFAMLMAAVYTIAQVATADQLQPGGHADDGHNDAADKRRQPLTEGHHHAQQGPEEARGQIVLVVLLHPRPNAAVDAEHAGEDVHDLNQLGGDSDLRVHKVCHADGCVGHRP